MGDERSGCGTGTRTGTGTGDGAGTLVMAASAMPTAVEQQPQQQQQLQQNFAEHLQQQQRIICGKCRGNNSTIWTIPCVYCEHSRNFPFFENKINNTHTQRDVCTSNVYRIFWPCLWNGKVPASGFGGRLRSRFAFVFACLPCHINTLKILAGKWLEFPFDDIAAIWRLR